MIDSHTHLEHAAEPEEWITRARAAGVQGMVSIGCGAESIEQVLEIAGRHEDCVRVAAGVHPLQAAAYDMADFPRVAELARHPMVVAIGETGFDLFHDAGTIGQQTPPFVAQCELARELGLPLIIHSRAAEQQTIDLLEQHAADLDVILHCFALAEPEHLEQVLAQDRWVCSFAGNLTYGTAQPLRDACARIPLERLMVETDAPYLAPKPHRGKRNEPAFVQHTLQMLADVRGLSFDEARAGTMATAERIYGWVPAAASV